MPKKTTQEIENELKRLRTSTDKWNFTEIQNQREEAYDYYFGEPYGTEIPGRSDIVTREVYDAVEWIKPELMRIFTSGERVVEFEPEGPEDVEAAQQETDYINYVFMRKNPGFQIMLDWIHDGLLQKNGVVKWWWDDSVETTEEVYENITLEMAQLLAEEHPDMQLEDFEIVREEEDGLVLTEKTVATFKVRKTRPQARVEVIPPEEFDISRDARSIKDARYVSHKKEVTYSDCRYMGFTKKQLDGITFSSSRDNYDWSPERMGRNKFDNLDSFMQENSGDESQETAWLREEYFYTDLDGSGKAVLVKAFTIDDKVLEWEQACEKPFASISPLNLPHRYYGLSLHDVLKDIQKAKSSITRSMLDNAQFMNHQRHGAVEGQVNLNDLLDSRPGGVVRLKSPNALVPLQGTSLDPNTFSLLEYMDSLGEGRSGVSRNSQGLDPNVLRSNVAASTVNQVMTAAMQKRDLMARIIAETGLTDLFYGLHGLIKRHQKDVDYVRLRENFVQVDPTAWKDRINLVVNVGLGNGGRDGQMAAYQTMTTNMQMLGAAYPHMITPQNAYDWFMKGFEIFGYKDGRKYVTDPSTIEPPEPEPDPALIKIQQEAELKQAQLAEQARHNQATEEIQEAEVVRKTMKDEEEAAIDRMELRIEAQQGRPVGIGD